MTGTCGGGVCVDQIPRSTNAGRGSLAGSAPVPRQVREIYVRIEDLGPRLRFSMPTTAPGWVEVAHTQPGLAAVLASAFTEAQVAAHSKWRGHTYDAPDPESTVYQRPPILRRGDRCDVHHPDEWRKDVDGRWVAPGSGRRFRPDSQQVQHVQAKRLKMGLPADPDPIEGTTP